LSPISVTIPTRNRGATVSRAIERLLENHYPDFEIVAVDQDLRFVHRDRRATYSGDVYAKLLRENFIVSGSNSMVRRSVLENVGGFDESLRAVEDWELHVRLAAASEFVNVPRVVVHYRKSENTLSSDTVLMQQSFLAARTKIFAVAPDEHRALQPKCTAAFYRYLATRSLQTTKARKKPMEAFCYMRTAVRNDALGSLRLFRLLNPMGPIRLAIRAIFRR
jgi:glycosyl transferase family 2